MKRAGVGAAIVAVLLVCWLLLDASGVLRAERRTQERITSTRDNVSDTSGATDSDSSVPHDEAPRIPAPVDLSKVDLDLDLHGVVVDQDGKPIADAKLATVRYPARRAGTLNMDRYYEEIAGPSTFSATDGTFRIRLERGALRNLRVSATGFATAEIKQLMAGEYVRVVLAPGVTLVVVATDHQKQPAPDVRLRLFSNSRSALQITRTATTDAQGVARIPGLPPGSRFYLEPLHDTLGSPGWKKIETAAGGEQRIELAMLEGRTLRGRVTDAATGISIEGAKVGMGWVMRHHTFTNRDGDYTLHGWAGSEFSEISVDAADYAQKKVPVENAEEINIQLVPGGAASGRVVDERGEPVKGARVDAIGSRHTGRTQITSRRYTTSGEDGTFRLRGLRLDFDHSLVVIAPGFGRKLVEFRAERPEKRFGDVVLTPGRSIEGTLYLGEEPLPRVEVSLSNAAKRRYPRILYGHSEERYTDHLGRFRFPDQTPGKFKLTVRRDGFGPIEKLVELRPDADLLSVELRFAAGNKFVVLVHNEQGEPIAAAQVQLQHEGGSRSARTGKDGAARFSVAGKVTKVFGPYLFDTHEYLRPDPVDNPQTNEVRFVMKKGATVAGKVMLDGRPLPHARIEVFRGGKLWWQGVTGQQDGTFRVVVPKDGAIDLILRGRYQRRGGAYIPDDANPITGELRGVAPGSKNVVLEAREVPKDRTLTVRVEDADGRAMASVRVRVGKAHGQTGKDGAILFEGLPRGPTTVFVNAVLGPGILKPAPRSVTPEGQEVVFRFERGVPVTGVVLRADGTPGKGIPVQARTARRFFSLVVADAQGRFTLYVPDKPDGKVFIQAWANEKDGTRYNAKADYVAGARILLELRKTR